MKYYSQPQHAPLIILFYFEKKRLLITCIIIAHVSRMYENIVYYKLNYHSSYFNFIHYFKILVKYPTTTIDCAIMVMQSYQKSKARRETKKWTCTPDHVIKWLEEKQNIFLSVYVYIHVYIYIYARSHV